MTADRPPFDVKRLVISIAVTAALSVAIAAAFLHFYPRENNVGATVAALGDAFAWMFGACIGLFVGSCAAALFTRTGSRFFTGAFAGVVGFWIGVAPYVFLTVPSDVTFSTSFGFVLIFFGPGIVFVAVGAALGAGAARMLARA